MMHKRFLSIWFPYLISDWLTIKRPALKNTAFVVATPKHGRKIITAVSPEAAAQNIKIHMPLADARAIVTDLDAFDQQAGREISLLKAIGEWCIRYSPIVSIDEPDGLFLDISGCPHLWGGEAAYMTDMVNRLAAKGYQVKAAIADTVGAAAALSRYGPSDCIVGSDEQLEALLPLSPVALRLDPIVLQRLAKLGFYQIRSFIGMPRSVLRRRFGEGLLLRLAQALGQEEEFINPIQLVAPYQERLSSLEPIRTATGIELAIKKLLEQLCLRLQQEGKGIRTASLKCYRIDGKVVETNMGTNTATNKIAHLCQLFGLKIDTIAPGLGIELFILEAQKVEDVVPVQEAFWANHPGLDDEKVAELLDRLTVKVGANIIQRYLPDEHYWPERSIKKAASIQDQPDIPWNNDRPRPTQLLVRPERIEVTAPIPDYPPMLFKYQGEVHHIKKADGPERIEREWWLDPGEHRDYYQVEDQHGQRYWLFRSGHYSDDQTNHWFIHGYFA